jgi:hypothetical protein
MNFDERRKEDFEDNPREVVNQDPHRREAKEPGLKWETHLSGRSAGSPGRPLSLARGGICGNRLGIPMLVIEP